MYRAGFYRGAVSAYGPAVYLANPGVPLSCPDAPYRLRPPVRARPHRRFRAVRGLRCRLRYGGLAGFALRRGVSSSIIRRLLHDEGAVERAAELLTYPYSLRGHIVAGYQVGRRLGFPTANICVDEPFKVLPAIGVYAVRVSLLEKFYKGMLYIGRRPTVHNGDDLSIEVHILDFSGDIYQDTIRVSFLRRVRGDIAFDSLEALSAQLEKDREAVAAMI